VLEGMRSEKGSTSLVYETFRASLDSATMCDGK
jgi:hypothetical protein